jgi:acyl carrier protein
LGFLDGWSFSRELQRIQTSGNRKEIRLEGMKRFEDVEKRLKSVIVANTSFPGDSSVNYPNIKPESTADDLGLDSLDLFELIMDIEDEFNIEISDDDIGKLKTFQDLVDFIPLGIIERKLDRR